MNQNTQLLIERAVYSLQNGNLKDAQTILKKILKSDPRSLPALQILGLICAQEDDYPSAVEYLTKAVKVSPNDPALHYNLAKALSMSGREERSIDHHLAVLRLTPDNPEAWLNYGNSLSTLGRNSDALVAVEKALNIRPNYVEALVSKAAFLNEAQEYGLAVTAAERAIQVDSNFPPAWSNLGNAFKKIGNQMDALHAYEKAIALDESYKDAWYNKGVLLTELKKLDEALNAYDHALAIDPHYIDAQWNRGLLELWRGNYSRGWMDFEKRWLRTGHPPREFLQIPELKYLGDAPGKKIIVWSEQGLGDTIQFCRYLQDLGSKANVTFRCQSALESLLSTQQFNINVCVNLDNQEYFDYQVPLLSLPKLFETRTNNIPFGKEPYIKIESNKSEWWGAKLGSSKKMRIGLVWAGGFRPGNTEALEVNKRRNIPLSKFNCLLDLDVELYSLQKGNEAENEFRDCGNSKIIDLTNELIDFQDTGALIECLDLVISVDTSVAHLSAAIGKKTWLLNRFDSCWRWILDEESSPWYGSIRVFNQPKSGDWDAVMNSVKNELNKELANRS